ncbi:secA2 [Symbiodinium sp. CCMP2592]|nr:secA2 [Symbiodinium sp. CCMP2592]
MDSPLLDREVFDVEFSDLHLAHIAVKHKPPSPEFAKTFQVKGDDDFKQKVAYLRQQLKIEQNVATNLDILRRACVLMNRVLKVASQGSTLPQQADELCKVLGQRVPPVKAEGDFQSQLYQKIEKLEEKWGRSESEDYLARLEYTCEKLGMSKDFKRLKANHCSCHYLADRCLAKSGFEEIRKVRTEIQQACAELKTSLDQEFNVERKVAEYIRLDQISQHARCEKEFDAVKHHAVEVFSSELRLIDDVATSDKTASFPHALTKLSHIISVLAFVSQVSDEGKSISKQFWKVLTGMDQKIKRLGTKNAAEVKNLFYPVLERAAAKHPSLIQGQRPFDYECEAQLIRQDQDWKDETRKLMEVLEQGLLQDFAAAFANFCDVVEKRHADEQRDVAAKVEEQIDTVLVRLLQYVQEKLSRFQKDIEQLDLEQATEHRQQLVQLRGFLEGEFIKSSERLQQICGKSLEHVGRINMELGKMQPKPLDELCLKAKSKMEAQAKDLLEHLPDSDSYAKLAALFAQLPQLGLLLGGSEVPSELKSQWRARIIHKVGSMDVTDEVNFKALVSMEKSLLTHVPEVAAKLQDLYGHLVECEEEFYASLDKDCMQSLGEAFAAFCTSAVPACTVDATSAEAINKIDLVLARLLQYVQEKLSRFENDIEQLDLEQAAEHRQQLVQLRGFLEGVFIKSSERLQQICGKSLEHVGRINMELGKMQPKPLDELCLKAKSKMEAQAKDLLEHLPDSDSHAKLAALFAQLPQLGLLLGGSEVPSELKSQWRARIIHKVGSMDVTDEVNFKALVSMEKSLSTHVPEVAAKLQDLYGHLVECEEEFYASLDKDCMQSLGEAFAAFCTSAVPACTVDATSAEAIDKIDTVLVRLLQYVQEKLSRFQKDIEQLDLEQATEHRQQLVQLRGFLEGEFMKSSERLQQICGKSLEHVGRINMELGKMQPKPLDELCLKAKSKMEAQAKDLLEHLPDSDSHAKLAALFAQLPQLGLLLGGSEVPSELKSQWRARIIHKVGSMDVSDEVNFKALVSMEKSLSTHVPEVAAKLQDLYGHLVECEEEFYASLDEDCMQSLGEDFADFCTYAVMACMFEATSAEAVAKIEAVLARLVQYVQEKLSGFEKGIEQLDLELATERRQQLVQLRGFLEGGFVKSSERLQRSCGKPLKQVGQVKKHLRKTQPKLLQKLCLKAKSNLEMRAQDLLKRLVERGSDSELRGLFVQLPQLDGLLGEREVSSQLEKLWREGVKEAISDVRLRFSPGTPFPFAHLQRLASISESLGRHVPEILDEVGRWKVCIKESIQQVAKDAEGDVEQWRKDKRSHVFAINLAKALINLASMHMNLPSAFADLADDARTYIAAMLDKCSALPKFHGMVLRLQDQLQSKGLDRDQSTLGQWILTTFQQFVDWRTADFNKKTKKKSADEILKEWSLPEEDELLLKTRSLAYMFERLHSIESVRLRRRHVCQKASDCVHPN